ncbi:MAG TPA: hypothetical protein VMR34_02270 [Candidatus Saccharimonadales bacterium]|nr:hypothetical protein [Candidatus Saccharimonadales bacterium]
MSRVFTPAMVGNDVVVNLNKKLITEKPARAKEEVTFSRPPLTRPIQSFSPLTAGSSGTSQPAFAMEPTLEYSSGFFTRSRVISLVIALFLIGLTVGVIAGKQQILMLASEAKAVARRAESAIPSKKVYIKPVVNPRQITVPTNQIDSAVGALVGQQILIKMGATSLTVNSTDIVNWLNLKNQGGNTTISINSQALSSYLTQTVATNSHTLVNRVILNKGYGLPVVQVNGQNGVTVHYSSAAYNQVANNLLSGKGMTVTVPTTVTPYQTITTGSHNPI